MVRVITIDYCPRRAFMPLHNRKQRWCVVVAHRRAGKTVACVNELIKSALTFKGGDGRFAYVAPFYRQAKSVAWDYVKRFSSSIEGVQINESELRVDYPNGSRIKLFGADNADALRGLFFDGMVADEYGDWKPSVWGYVIRPALADRQGWAIIIGTPKGRNQFWEMYQISGAQDGWLQMTIKASESGLLPEAELAALKLELTEDAWKQEMECDFEAAIPGAYYGAEMYLAQHEGRVGIVEHQEDVMVYTAWDLGFSDDTSIWFYQIIRGEINVLEYYGSHGKDMRHYFEQIYGKEILNDDWLQVGAKFGSAILGIEHRTKYKYAMHNLPHDARAKTLASMGKSIQEMAWRVLGSDKVNIVPNLSLQDGIQAVRQMLHKTQFDKNKCYEGVQALTQYQREYDEDKKCFRDKPLHNWASHACDAMRMVAVSWRQKAEATKPPEPIFKSFTNMTFNDIIAANKRKREA